jgi:hypothetical protein
MNVGFEKRNFGPYYYDWDTHKLQQPAAFLIVFASYFDCSSRETFHVFGCACGTDELRER